MDFGEGYSRVMKEKLGGYMDKWAIMETLKLEFP